MRLYIVRDLQQFDFEEQFFEQHQFARKARILVCDIAQTGPNWVNVLYKQRAALGQSAYDGDLYVLSDYGSGFLEVRTEKFCAHPYLYQSKSSDFSPAENELLRDYVGIKGIEHLAHYDTIEIVALGLGVRAAAYLLTFLPQSWFETKKIAGIALNGTVSAQGTRIGLPPTQWASRLDNLSEASLQQFYLSQFNTKKRFFNLFGASTSYNCAKVRQRKRKDEAAYQERVRECCASNCPEPYIEMATDIVTWAAHSLLFDRPSKELSRLLHTTRDYWRQYGLMKVSAELRYLPFIDLGATGRALFNRCFKLAYASADGVLFSATAVKGDILNQYRQS